MSKAWRVAIAGLLAVALGVTGFSRAALERGRAERTSDRELLYLPNGKYLALASLGHATLLADLVYLWAIQFYSDYERADRYRYVEHVFSRVITELDPHYVDAYWLGALILSVEAGDLPAALRVLDKGIEANPDEWILPYVAAWECYRAQRYDRAAEYFARAAAVPGAPAVLRRMRAGMFSKKGELQAAVRLWRDILEDPESDDRSVAIARRQLRDLQVSVDVLALEEAVERFRKDNGRHPRELAELVRRGYVDSLPRDPDERHYEYDAATGRVSSSAGRVLGST